jgi:hypothetical protein
VLLKEQIDTTVVFGLIIQIAINLQLQLPFCADVNLISHVKGKTQGAGNNCILKNVFRSSESGDYEEFYRLGYDAM